MQARLMNMCMIENDNGEVLVQDRYKGWCGIAFPGGKVDDGESIVQSTIREIKEETGLDIDNLKLCNIKTWIDTIDKITNVVFCFKTNSYSGDLIEATYEGKNFWVKKEDLKKLKLAENFETTLALYFNNKTEVFWKKENDEWKEFIY